MGPAPGTPELGLGGLTTRRAPCWGEGGQGSTDGLTIGPTSDGTRVRCNKTKRQGGQISKWQTVGTEGATGRRIKGLEKMWRRGDREYRWINKKPPPPDKVDAR